MYRLVNGSYFPPKAAMVPVVAGLAALLSWSPTIAATTDGPVVSKTATGSYDETHIWTIQKSVDPASQTGFAGDTLSWTWKLDVSETATNGNFKVAGTISVLNPTAETMFVNVSDQLNDGTVATVDCGAGSTILKVQPGETASCSYVASPSGMTATLNTATVTFNGTPYQATAAVTFAVNKVSGTTATLKDPNIGLSEVLTAGAGPWSFTATDSYTCSALRADYGGGHEITKTRYNAATLDGDQVALNASAETTIKCRAGFTTVIKTTSGRIDPTMDWQFGLFLGPDGFGGVSLGGARTLNDLDGLLEFRGALRPDATYTLCEHSVPAGYSGFWSVNGDPVIPYNPDDGIPSEDYGNRCVDFGAGTTIAVSVGETVQFSVDNRTPTTGGDPRTPGYWKNWTRCSGGNQAANADRQAVNAGFLPGEGWKAGFWLLDDVLNPAIGGGIVWDDILADSLVVNITSCEQGTEILDQRVVTPNGTVGDGRKLASDGARTLAMHLLAAQLNFGAGACTTQPVLDAALAAETLLDSIDFDGTLGTAYLRSGAMYEEALRLKDILDRYNNGAFCGSLVP